jgi:hypothetical protein
MDGVHVRTLERAIEIVQSKERLAVALEISLGVLEAYLAEEKPLPTKLLIEALDIVATNGHQKHRGAARGPHDSA